MYRQTTWHLRAGELNHFRDELLELARENKYDGVRLDCGQADALSSEGFSNLVALNNHLAGDLTLVNVGPHLRRLLQLTRLDQVLDVRCQDGH